MVTNALNYLDFKVKTDTQKLATYTLHTCVLIIYFNKREILLLVETIQTKSFPTTHRCLLGRGNPRLNNCTQLER